MKKNIQDLLNVAQDMIDDGKISECLEYLKSLKPIKEYTEREKTIFYTLNSEIHLILFNITKSYVIAKKGIRFARKIEKSIELVDALLIMVKNLVIMGKISESMDLLEESSEVLMNLPQVSEKDRKRRLGLIFLIQGLNFYQLGKMMESSEKINKSIDLLQKWNSKANLALAYAFYGNFFMIMGESNKALNNLSKAQKICENNNSIAYHLPKLMNFIGWGIVYHFKGELQLAVEYNKKVVSLARKSNNPIFLFMGLGNLGEIYKELEEWDHAIKYLQEALIIAEHSRRSSSIVIILSNLFDVYINMGDIVNVKQVFHKMEHYQAEEKENKKISQIYRSCKAVLMKMSKRTRDIGGAQVIFKAIAQEEVIQIDITQNAILNLCKMLLEEFQETKNFEVIEEFSTSLKQLQNATEKHHAYPLLAETYLLEAKLSMINFDLKKARQSLTKAQQIAEKYGLKQLAIKISYEHDKLLENLKDWDQMKKENVSYSERLEKLDINDNILTLLKKKPAKIPETSPESPILLLVMANSGIPIYTKIFNKEWEISENLFSSFLLAFNSFSHEIFSEGLDRANFGTYTILMTGMPPFMTCYVFKGQSFLAHQKFSKFNESIHESDQIWKNLTSSNRTGQVIKDDASAGLGKLVKTIF
ncbi:tetratricopeptide repeat protein [Promethearchaeum syntrophicum]|uniref:Tetratricopeptide repeat protein n=1 Tax=Promethearchaeum syntrophicum TaxID=2594042 RepID=A0A5B9DEC2_9ARCH|nr:tetratricopeptide repeat protein [Candidatus Prometheoarchaeum syntrophicum]QEE17598.1 Tetratricopeptide repeat protein [Candidatus Prometheoarchaeum syntrophicum]